MSDTAHQNKQSAESQPEAAPEAPAVPLHLQAAQIAQAMETVKALIAAGVISPQTLGMPAAPAEGVTRSLVPGERITVRDLAAAARETCTVNTKRTYGTYMRLLSEGWPARAPKEEKLYAGIGDLHWDEVLPKHLEEALAFVECRALLRAQWRGEVRAASGRSVRMSNASGAKYNAVGAWRRMGRYATQNRHLATGFDPTQELDKPRRSNGNRHALEPGQLEDVRALFTSTGDDPELDTMIVDTILVSGARQEGLVNLHLGALDLEECTIRLDEKFGKVVDQPVPDHFVQRLHDFAVSRGATSHGDKVFRKRAIGSRPTKPIGPRRFNYMFDRLQAAFEWADKQQVTAHTLRHHAITAVERASSLAVAVRFARHEPQGTNQRYSKASDREVAEVVVRLYGGDHPWLHRPRRHRAG